MILRFIRGPRRAAASLLVLALAGCAASGGDGSPTPEPTPAADGSATTSRPSTLADGAFSAEQAARGSQLFGQVCGECHATREFRGTDFFFAWEGSTVGRFVQLVSETMPEDDPGGLPMDQYLAVAAYVLDMNDFPAGDSPLPNDPGYLGSLRITRPAGGVPAAAFPLPGRLAQPPGVAESHR